MQYWEETIDQLAKVRPSVRKRVTDAIIAILSASEPYRGLSDTFSFEAHPALDAKVNEILIGLSDSCKAEARQMSEEIISWLDYELNVEAIISDAEEGDKGITWAFDMHCTNLKKLLGVWIAIEFTNVWSKERTLGQVLAWMNSPDASKMWKKAVLDRVIDPNEVKFGKGYQRNIIDALSVTEQGVIYDAFLIASAWGYELDGAIGVVVHRGSEYDCPLCDSLLGRVWPLDQIPIPAHPRCVCYLEPVFDEE